MEFRSNELAEKEVLIDLTPVCEDIVYDGRDCKLVRGNELELSLTTYMGSFNAEHYYGKLSSELYHIKDGDMQISPWNMKELLDGKPERFEVELVHKISRKEAIHLNKKNDYLGISVRAGEHTSGFESPEAVLKMAKKVIDKHFKNYVIRYNGVYRSDEKLFLQIFEGYPMNTKYFMSNI